MLKNIPTVTRNLLFINIIIFMVQQVISQRTEDVLTHYFGLHFYMAEDFRIWQLVTYMFLHGSWQHVLLNMFSLWMFGRIIENTMGQQRFLIYYFVCGIGAGLCQELWQTGEFFFKQLYLHDMVYIENTVIPMSDYLNLWVTIGASGACYGVLLAFGMTFPNDRIMLLIPPIPMKAKYFVIFYALIEVWSAFSSNGNIAHFAHLGGMLFGFLLILHWRKKERRGSQGFSWGSYGGNRNTHSKSGGVLQNIRTAFQRFGAAIEEGVRSFFGVNNKNDGYDRNSNSRHRYSNPDHEYNARKRAQQERIDEILDKVRRSGYASLTEDEKRELFDNSNRR